MNLATADLDTIILFVGSLRKKLEKLDLKTSWSILRTVERLLGPHRERLIDNYLSAAKTVRHERKTLSVKKLRERRQTHLKQLLTPLATLRLLELRDIPCRKSDGTYPFINEKIWINKELDVQHLNYNRERYRIQTRTRWNDLPDLNFNEPLDPESPDGVLIMEEVKKGMDELHKWNVEAQARGNTLIPITLSSAYKGYYSLKELWDKWIDSLTQEVMESKDLLDQILITYTIKRAMNEVTVVRGDKQRAINKLYNLYVNRAMAVAVNVAKKRRLPFNDVRQIASILLKFILSGFGPGEIVAALKEGAPKQYIPIPKWVEQFHIYYLSEYVPEKIREIMKQPQNPLLGLAIGPLLDPHTAIADDTLFRHVNTVRRFNSCCFRPTKKNNLTVWLFGTKRNPRQVMQGKFPQMLNDVLYRLTKSQKEWLFNPSQDGEDEDKNKRKLAIEVEVSEQITARDRDGDQSVRDLHDKDLIGQIKNMLTNNGITERDVEIFFEVVNGAKKNQLGRKYNLSRMQIHRIFNKIKSSPILNNEELRQQLKDLLTP